MEQQEANIYFQRKGINQILESLLVGLSINRPDDPLSYIEDCMSQIREENRNGKGNKLPWDTFLSPASKQYAMRREQQRKAGLTGKIGMRASFKTEVPAEVPSDIDGFKVLPPIAPGNSSRPTTNNDNKLGKTQPTPLPDIKQSSSSSSSQTPTVKSAGGISSKPTTANGFSSSSSKPDTVPTTATSNTTGNTSKPTTASNNKNSYAVNSSKPTTAANNEQTIKKSRPPQWDNIVFVLGGPGSGKGTQCARLAVEFNYIHLSAGDLLRAEVSTGSELGKTLDKMMKEGAIVPLDITLRLLREAMERAPSNARGFLIDGFPRQLDQAKAFEAQICSCKFVLFFDCPEATMLERLIKRGETSGRADDNSETIKKRFKTFVETSYPVIEEFQKIGKCVKVSSVPVADEVYASVREYFVSPSERGPAWNNIVFILGGPGSGRVVGKILLSKGTQCERLAKDFEYTHISSGDLMRAEVATGSELGQTLDGMMKEGKIVPIEITLGLIRVAMLKSSTSAKGFLIDGFPRQMDQAAAFEATIAPCKFVLYFECSEALMETRLLKRGETSGRADDNAATIKKRFKTFMDLSYPVVQHFDKIGKCIKLSSEPPVAEVYELARQYFIAPEQRGNAWTNIVLVLGGPGSGKGTQCERVAKEFNYAHLSTGDLLRAEVASGSSVGKDLESLMKEGKIVPLDVTLGLLRRAMVATPSNFAGFLIDGFPRELVQARAFEATVAPSKFVLCFECPEDILMQRLLKRGETSGRADDNADTIKKRFATFTNMSYPVVEEYGRMGKLVKIYSTKPVDEVYAETREFFVNVNDRPAAWKNIVFVLGGPGSGKGTQCARISSKFNYNHLSVGDLLREEVASGSEIGQQLDALMKEGKIVSQEITLRLLKKAMLKASPSAAGFLIDGFPRQLDQARTFEYTIAQCKFVLYFDLPEDVMQQRLLKRGETSGRADDNAETIKKRFKTFVDASMPVIKEYERHNKCIKISSMLPADEVFESICPHF